MRPPVPFPPRPRRGWTPREPDGGVVWAIAAMAAVCFFAWGAWSAWEDHARHLRWRAVAATVEQVGPGDALRYRYRVAGVDHVGTRFHAIPLAGWHRRPEVPDGLRVGDRLTARYDPRQPSESFVSPGVSLAPFGVMAGALGSALLVFGLWSRFGGSRVGGPRPAGVGPAEDDQPIERAA